MRGVLFALLAALLLAGCGVDAERSIRCRTLIPAFEPAPERVEILDEAEEADTLTVRYRAEGAERWIACRFRGRHGVEAVATDRTGALSPMQMAMLRLWAGLPQQGAIGTAVAASAWTPVLFFLQLVINAVTVACVYGLLAIGYTLVFGILGQVNLAMGELTMVGAMLAAMASAGLGAAGGQGAIGGGLALLAVLGTVMVLTGVHGWAIDRLVFRHLRGRRVLTPLIAAIGLSIAYQEGVRNLHGARDWWPPPAFAIRHDLLEAGGFTVTALTSQALILGLAAALYTLLWWIIQRTDYGRAHRACADDWQGAALLGVNIERTVAVTFVIGGAYAGAAGYVIALYYGGVNFFTGYLIGFKALTAAVIGGIGSVPGAMLGGALLGLFETFWSAYFTIAYKDVVAFGLLALFLIYRPDGLLGQPRSRGD